MDKELPKVSIVLPTHNGAKYIRQSIDSCLSQTYKNIELIIVDDCSIDETPNIVMSYSDERIKYVRHDSNKRLPAALNTGFEIATGEYLTWTSDDNFFYAHAIEKMLSCFLTQRNIDVVYANYQAEFENGDTKYIDVGLPSDLFIYDSIGPCFIFRRQIYDKLGGYNTGWALVEDYEYWLKIYTNNYRFYRLSDVLYFYRYHSSSLTTRNLSKVIKLTDSVRNQYILDHKMYNVRKKADLFLAIARFSCFNNYKLICLKNLVRALFWFPPILARLDFLRVAMRLFVCEADVILRRIGRRTLPAPVRAWLRTL